MSTKEEIIHLIDELPDKLLKELLSYLKQVETTKTEPEQFSIHLKKILEEDKELLKRLAE